MSINKEVTVCLGISLGLDISFISLLVLSSILHGSLGGSNSSFGAFSLGSSTGINTSFEELGISGLLLNNILWDNFSPKTKHAKRDVSQPI